MKRTLTSEELLTRWESRRELQNLMGKLSQSYLMMEQAEIYDRWWSGRDDVCLGVNRGWYSGKEAVSRYYRMLGAKIELSTKLLKQAFPDKLGDKTDEALYGVGQVGIQPVDTFVLEVASDNLTAKGLWSIHGTYAEVTPAGPVSFWEWGYYCVDFVNEPGGWKIWHMQYLLDINCPTGGDWAEPPLTFEPDESFARMADFRFPEPNIPGQLRQTYRPGRVFTESPPLPEPYDVFAETFSYGL